MESEIRTQIVNYYSYIFTYICTCKDNYAYVNEETFVDCMFINPFVPSVLNKVRLTKISILI